MKGRTVYLTLEVLSNLALPWLAYAWAKPLYGEVPALLASAAPPLAWSLGELIRFRRLDALSALVLCGIALSLLGLALGGSPRLLLVRESLASGLVGFIFLGSLFLQRPIVFYVVRAAATRREANAGTTIETWWHTEGTARSVKTLTLVWGAGLVFEAVLRAWLAWHWTPERYLALSPLFSYGFFGLLFGWTLWHHRQQKKLLPQSQ